jgi:hypothetical protein
MIRKRGRAASRLASAPERSSLMPRTNHRERRSVSVRRARLLPLLGFRYSTTRDAYVLRSIGNRFGPVYQVAVAPRHAGIEAPADTDTLSAK